MNERPTFAQEIANVINSYSRENESNTPDFILAMYMQRCLEAFEIASKDRERWYGKSLSINSNATPALTETDPSVKNWPSSPLEVKT